MTYCLGIKVRDGLVCLADGRITSGTQLSSARKVTMIDSEGHRFVIMNSGLRSIRDKSLGYLRQRLEERPGEGFLTLRDAVNAYCEAVRRTATEDKESLEASNLNFNLHALICGQLANDREPNLFLVYPEANWIEVDERTPYLSIGNTSYGKPILDRALRHATSLRSAVKIAYLSFDSSRFSSADVGYPIDLLTYRTSARDWQGCTFHDDDLIEQRLWWNRHITDLAEQLPDDPWYARLVGPVGP